MGFFDLNIPYHEADRHATDKSSLRGRRLKLALKAMELGYTGIAYNRSLKGVMSESDRCTTPLFPLTKLIPSSSAFFASVKFHRDLLNVPVSSPFRQYTRLTVFVDNPSQMSSLNAGNPVLRSYDIVAVRPMNQNAFDHACRTSEVDIIAIDFSDKLLFRLKQPMVKAAIKRGVYFEIPYSVLIGDAQSRRQMISNCKLLVDWTRGKNLILSSAALSATEFRGPQDVANLFSLLGLSGERAKAAISKNCRSLLANALRKKHFYKEAVKVEALPSGEQVNTGKSTFDDWLKWDPISSGEGDMSLDDMEKSFAGFKSFEENVKSINFTSNKNGLPAHGLQIKDLICETRTGLGIPDTNNPAPSVMKSNAAIENPKDQAGHKSLHLEHSSTPENQCGLGNLSKEQRVILEPEGQTPSSGAGSIHLSSGTQDAEVSFVYVSNKPLTVLPLTEHGQACIVDAKIGQQISDFEDSAQLSLPYNDKSANSEYIEQILDEKLEYVIGLEANRSEDLESNLVRSETQIQDIPDLESNLVRSETQVQDIPSLVHGEIAAQDGEGLHITKIKTPTANNDVAIELLNPLAISKSFSSAFLLESTMKNQRDIDACAQEGVPKEQGIENIQLQPLASSGASSLDVYMDGQHTKTSDSSVKLADGFPVEGFLNVTTDFSEPIIDDIMEVRMQIDYPVTKSRIIGKSQAGRVRRKRKSPHQPFLFPFKHFAKPRHFKRNSRN